MLGSSGKCFLEEKQKMNKGRGSKWKYERAE
jgi:hypothetical protein